MKNFIICTLLVLFCISCKQSQSIVTTSNNQFQIKKIKEEKSTYVIDAIRNDSIFKIIAEKSSGKIQDCSKIKTGKYYSLELVQIFPIKDANGSYYSMIREFEHKGTVIKIDRKFHSTVYLATNLKGICIVD